MSDRSQQALADSLRQDAETIDEFEKLLQDYGFHYEFLEYYIVVFTGDRRENPEYLGQHNSSFYRLNKFKWDEN